MATTLDDDRRELTEAEQRLFAVLDLEHRSGRLSLADTPVKLFSGRTPYPHHAFSEDELAHVSVPTRFVWGSEGRFQHPDDGRRAAALMRNADLVQVPGGHHPWWDDAERCSTLILEVISYDPGADHTSADRCRPGE
jgi:pimeloyl-ACP methyl ester carboxylesterase